MESTSRSYAHGSASTAHNPRHPTQTRQASTHSHFRPVSPLTRQGFGPRSSRCRPASVVWPALTLPSGSLCCLALSSSLLSPYSLVSPAPRLSSHPQLSTDPHRELRPLPGAPPRPRQCTPREAQRLPEEFHVTPTPNGTERQAQ